MTVAESKVALYSLLSGLNGCMEKHMMISGEIKFVYYCNQSSK